MGFDIGDTLKIDSYTYRFQKKIRAGERSTVWLGVREDNSSSESKKVIIKELNPKNLDEHQELKSRLELEALIYQQLQQRADFVTCYGCEFANDNLLLVTEYVESETLAQRLEGGRIIELDNAIPIIRQLCDILHVIHKHNLIIVHRDLKPSNILITEDNKVFIIDFTYALVSEQSLGTRIGNEQSGTIGTPAYMAPEQEQDPSNVSAAADIYSLALVLVEMLTGQKINDLLKSQTKKFDQVLREELPQALQKIGDSYIFNALKKALHPQPSERYQDVLDFKYDLVEPPPSSFSERIINLVLRPFSRKKESEWRPVVGADKMVYIDRGSFMTGIEKEVLKKWETQGYESKSQSFDRDKKTVSSFYIDPTPVTNRQYLIFVKDIEYDDQRKGQEYRHPSRKDNDPRAEPYLWRNGEPPQELLDHPVVLVSYEDAVEYATWAGKRLPTEIEWEWAARGKESNLYPWANEWDRTRCNSLERWAEEPIEDVWEQKAWQEHILNFVKRGIKKKELYPMTTPVTTFPQREWDSYDSFGALKRFQLFDLVGNVWEWTNSPIGGGKNFILKGGAWLFGAVDACAASRVFLSNGERLPYVGFRCVANPEDVERTLSKK